MSKCRAQLRLHGDRAVCETIQHHPKWLGTNLDLHSDRTQRVEWTDETTGAVPNRPPTLWEQMNDQLQHAYSQGDNNFIVMIDGTKWDAFLFERPMHGQFHFTGRDQHGRWMTTDTDFGTVRCFEFRAAEGTEWIQVRSWKG